MEILKITLREQGRLFLWKRKHAPPREGLIYMEMVLFVLSVQISATENK